MPDPGWRILLWNKKQKARVSRAFQHSGVGENDGSDNVAVDAVLREPVSSRTSQNSGNLTRNPSALARCMDRKSSNVRHLACNFPEQLQVPIRELTGKDPVLHTAAFATLHGAPISTRAHASDLFEDA